MKILIETIPHSQQRYETCGDWQWEHVYDTAAGESTDEPILRIRVSETADWRHSALVAVHELVEALLCKHAGVTEQQVDEFDFAYEAARNPGDDSEPGNDPACPCYIQHGIATEVECYVATSMQVNWAEYDKVINALSKT